MTAQLIDGKAIALKVRLEVAAGVAAFRAEHGRPPGLRLMLVGDHPGSARHIQNKQRASEQVGLAASAEYLPALTEQAALLARVDALNAAPEVDAILVQLPLPAQLDAAQVIARIDPRKDVDGLTPHNAGLLALGRPALVPHTPSGCLRLLDEIQCQLAGKRALVIGRSVLVGRPLSQLLLARDATVTVAHSRSAGLAELVAEADVLVAAAGVPGLVHGSWLKPGAIVLDVGQTTDQDGRLRGDLEFERACERAAWITPVPGGVGPMTVAMLLSNTLAAARAAAP